VGYRNFYLEWFRRTLKEAFVAVGFERRAKPVPAAIMEAIETGVAAGT
jgi:hypothetical protein